MVRGWGECRTKVLDLDFAGEEHGGLFDDAGLAVLERLFGGRVVEADAVEVFDAGGFGNLDLDVLNSCVDVVVERGGEVPDGLLRSCRKSVPGYI